MIYPQIHKRPIFKRHPNILLISAIVILVGGAVQYFRPSFFPAVFTTLVRPFWRSELSLASGSLRTPDELLRDNQALQIKLDDANLRLKTVQAVEDENGSLKSLMGRASTTEYILAAVLKHPPLAAYDEFIIDIGADHKITVGNNVYAPGNVLIGRVSAVLGQTSKVRLFSSPNEKYQVYIGDKNTPATAFGRGGGQYEAQLPRDVSVKEGDFVMTPSLSDRPFGVVSAVLSDPTQPFEKILFSPPINIYELRWVLVDPAMRLI